MKYFGLIFKRSLQIGALSLSVLLILGCDFDQPISSQATTAIDAKLLGTWEAKDGTETEYIKISKKDQNHYAGSFWESDKPKKIESFTAWSTMIEGQNFVTIDLGKQESKPYLYLKLDFEGKQSFTYHPVSSDSAFAKDTKGSVIERLKRHLQDKDLLRDQTSFTRSAK